MTITTKIAIVEDESHIRALLEQTLEDLDGEFEVFTAANGAEGLQLIQQEALQRLVGGTGGEGAALHHGGEDHRGYSYTLRGARGGDRLVKK